MPKLLTLPEVQAHLRVSRATVRHLISRGQLAIVKVGRRTLVARQALEAFVWQQGRVAVAAAPQPATTGTHETHSRALEARIRAMHARGLTHRQIANRLNKAGERAGTPSGRWDVDTVQAWLETNVWVGDIRVG
jgi:excisionase family DNA binding protein